MQKPRESDDVLAFDDDIGSLKRKSFRGGMGFAFSQAGLIVLQIASTMILARLLTPSDFGLAAMVAPLMVAIGVFSDLGLGQAVLRHRELTYAHLSNMFWVSLTFHLGLMVVFLVFSPLVGQFYGRPELTMASAVYCTLFVSNGLGALQRAVQVRRLQFARVGYIKLTASACGQGMAIFIAMEWPTFWALIAIPITGSIVGTALSWLFSGWRPGLPDRKTDVREMIGFGGNMAIGRFLTYTAANADSVMIGKAWGPVELGYYDRAFRLMVAPTSMITSPLSSMVPTVFARLLESPERYRRSVLGVMRLVLLAAVPGVIFAFMMAHLLIPIVYGQAWNAVIPIFQAFGVATLVRFQTIMIEWLYLAEGRDREFRTWAIFKTCVLIGSFAVGLPWGGLGVATAYAGAFLLVLLPFQVVTVTRWSLIKMSDIGRTFLLLLPGLVLATAATAALANVQGISRWIALPMGLILSYVIVWGVAWLFPAGRRSFKLGLDVLRHSRSRAPLDD